MGRKKGWTCQKVQTGKQCKHLNAPGTRKCGACGKPRPVRKKAAHMAALELTYEDYITLNGGEFCGVCGRKPSSRRRLDRDHDHKLANPRGLLCARCNRALPAWITIEWLRAAIAYLDRAKDHLTEYRKQGK